VGDPVAEPVQPLDRLVDRAAGDARPECSVQVRNPQPLVVTLDGQVAPEPEREFRNHLPRRWQGAGRAGRRADGVGEQLAGGLVGVVADTVGGFLPCGREQLVGVEHPVPFPIVPAIAQRAVVGVPQADFQM